MKRSEITEFIRQGFAALSPSIEFGSGKVEDFNSERMNVYPKGWMESPRVSTDYPTQGVPLDGWQVNIYIAKKDALDSAPEQYEPLVDDCDFFAQRLIAQLRAVIEGYKLTSIEGSERIPWIKKNADCITGVNLKFLIRNQDQTTVC